MQISAASSAGTSMGLQALRDLFQPAAQTSAGQTLPTSQSRSSSRAPMSGQPPAGLNGGGFNPATMASLLNVQEGRSSPGAQLVGETDQDGDGSMSVGELAAALQTEASGLEDTFGQIDEDGDGKITGAEMDAGLMALFEKNGPPTPPSGMDIASSLLGSADTDEGGSLSLSEILSALGEEEDSDLSKTFDSYDADGDDALSANELSSAIETMMAKALSAYGDTGRNADWTASLAA